MKKYLAYLRVSSKKRADNDNSLPYQKRVISEYAERSGLDIVEWYEEVHSAFRGKRPQFKRMLKHLEEPGIRGAIFHKIDRIARNVGDFAELDRAMDQGKDIAVIEGRFDTGTPQGRLAFRNFCNHAVFYSENLSDEVTGKMGECLRRGYYPAHAPLGYRHGRASDPDPKKLYPDSERSRFIKLAFEQMATGAFSVRSLAEHLRQQGMTNSAGNPPRKSTIAKLLRNPFYHGRIEWRAKSDGSVSSYAGNHGPLISKRLFDRVQAVLDGRLAPNRSLHDFAYSRLIRCECGRLLIPSMHKGRTYMVCQNTVCPFTSIREDAVEDAVIVGLARLRLSQAYADYGEAAVHRLIAEQQASRTTRHEDLRRALAAVERRLKRLKELLIDGVLSPLEVGEDRETLMREEAEIRLKLTGAEKEPEALKEGDFRRAIESLDRLPLHYRGLNPLMKRQVVGAIFSDRQCRNGLIQLKPALALTKAAEADALLRVASRSSNESHSGRQALGEANLLPSLRGNGGATRESGSNGWHPGATQLEKVESGQDSNAKNIEQHSGRPSGPNLEHSTLWCHRAIRESVTGLAEFLATSAGRLLDCT